MDYRFDRRTVSLLQRCRTLRAQQTPAERALWDLLRGRRLDGLKFRRQHQFGPCILDFYCVQARVAVEVDGAHHREEPKRGTDEARDAFLRLQGIAVVRLTNAEVLQAPAVAVRKIRAAIRQLLGDQQDSLSPETGAPSSI